MYIQIFKIKSLYMSMVLQTSFLLFMNKKETGLTNINVIFKEFPVLTEILVTVKLVCKILTPNK